MAPKVKFIEKGQASNLSLFFFSKSAFSSLPDQATAFIIITFNDTFHLPPQSFCKLIVRTLSLLINKNKNNGSIKSN